MIVQDHISIGKITLKWFNFIIVKDFEYDHLGNLGFQYKYNKTK